MTEPDPYAGDPTPIRDWIAMARGWRRTNGPWLRQTWPAAARVIAVLLVEGVVWLALLRAHHTLPWHPDLGLILPLVTSVWVLGSLAVESWRRRPRDAHGRRHPG